MTSDSSAGILPQADELARRKVRVIENCGNPTDPRGTECYDAGTPESVIAPIQHAAARLVVRRDDLRGGSFASVPGAN